MQSSILICSLAILLLTACSITGNVIKEFNAETEVYFCPVDNCRQKFFDELYYAENISCAIYDVDLPELVWLLNEKEAKLVLDDETSNRTEFTAIFDQKYTQMHNKFCILDGKKVISGSMNPTYRDTSVNYNNLLIIHSKNIANTYQEEFDELYAQTFSGGERTTNSEFYINNEKINIYFCPEDWCVNKVLDAMAPAQESIYFMTFSFTHDKIGDMLINKHREGLSVAGIMEKSQNNAYSEYPRLQSADIPVQWEATGANLHHKVFIIDRKIVITGSMNPSINGDTKNDENLLIIEDPILAEKYISEFNRLLKK